MPGPQYLSPTEFLAQHGAAAPFDQQQASPDASPSWGDYAHAFMGGVDELKAGAYAFTRYLSELSGNPDLVASDTAGEKLANMDVQDQQNAMTAAGRSRLNSAITSSDFWSHPFSSAALKTVGMMPQVAAALVPAALTSGTLAGVLGAAAAGGAINTGFALDNFYKKVDGLSDKQLQAQSQIYRGLRKKFPEAQARRMYDLQLQGMKPALNFIVGAAAGAVGPAGIVGRGGVAGAEGVGRLAAAGMGAAEAGVGAGVQGGVADATTQAALMQGGVQKKFDPSEVANAALEPAVLAGMQGGAAGAIFGGHAGASEAAKPEAKPEAQVPAQPVAEPAVQPEVQPDSYPKGNRERGKGKGKGKKGKKGVEVVQADLVAPDQAEALAQNQPAPVQPVAEPAPQPQPTETPVQPVAQEQPAQEPAPAQQAAPAQPIEPAVPHAPGEVVPGWGRVLLAQDKEAADNLAAQNEQLQQQLKSATREPVEKPTKSHKGKKVDAAKLQNAQRAGLLFDEVVPERRPIPQNTKERDAFVNELRGIVNTAKERGIEIPQRPGRSKDASHLMWLRDAEKLVNKKRPTVGDAVTFIKREMDIKNGHAAEVRAERAAEGDAFAKQNIAAQPEPETAASNMSAQQESPEEVLARNEEEGNTSEFKSEKEAYEAGRERKKVIFEAPKETAAGKRAEKVEKLAKQGATEGERAAAQSALSRIAKPGEESGKWYTVGKDNAGKVKVEGGKSRFKGMKPAVEKVVLKAKPRLMRATLAKNPPTEESKTYRFAVINHKGDLTEARGLTKTDVKSVYKHIDLHNPDAESHLTAAFHPLLRAKILKAVGHLPVHFVTREEMGRLGGDENALGQYDPHHNHIVVSEDLLGDPRYLRHVITHESVHALTERALSGNKQYAAAIQRIMSEVKAQAPHLAKTYGFTNEHEFLSEAMSNPTFQEEMSHLAISRDLARHLSLEDWHRYSMWTALVRVIQRALGVPHSALEAAMSMTERLAYHNGLLTDDAEKYTAKFREHRELKRAMTELENAVRERQVPRQFRLDMDQTRERLRSEVSDRALNAGAARRRLGDWASSMWMLADRAKSVSHEFGRLFESVVAAKARLQREVQSILEKEGGLQLVNDLAKFERQHGKQAYDDMASVGIDASNLNVVLGKGADNSHLGKDATKGWQAKAKLPALQKRFDELSPEAQQLLKRTAEFYRDTHNKISLALIKNILDKAGVHEKGLAERIFTDGLTDEDKEKFKSDAVIKALENAAELKQIKGWYVPFRRYGDHVVSGEYDLTAPPGALKVGNNTVQFTDPTGKGGDTAARRAAEKFVGAHELRHIATKKVWVDKNDPTVELDAEDANAVPAYRVRMQVQHTEFHQTPALARAARQRLEQEGLKNIFEGTKYDEAARSSSLVSGELKTILHSLEQQPRFKDMSKVEQDALRQALTEASVRMMGSTKLQSSFLQRRGVAGMSHDLTRVTADYSRSSAGYLARLRHQPEVDAAFKALQEHVKQSRYANPVLAKRRDELLNEITRRFKDDVVYQPRTTTNKAVRRLLQISRLDKLAGVSFHVINSMEPWTTSMPYIAGRHGAARTLRAMNEAYNLIGARKAVGAGLKDTVKAFSSETGFTDYIQNFKNEISKSVMVGGDRANRLQEVLDFNQKRGLFGDEAVFEVGRYADPTQNALARGLDRADLMANQMGLAIEKINRSVTALAAYELEYRRTHNHEAALQYSHEVARTTMGDYSGWNSAPAFKSSYGQLALQFKKFAHKTYYLVGKTFSGMIHGDAEAAKQFGGLMVTHMLVAGALGLPVEPIKVGLMAANWMGVTDYNWTDVEGATRLLAASVLGVKGGEAFSHGLTRLIGVDISGRMGFDSLLTFGSSRSSKPQDIKAYLWDTLAGAPVNYLLDQIKVAQALNNGRFEKAAELFVPIKAVSDAVKAGEGLGPQVSINTGRETLRGYNPFEIFAQAMGFTPSVKMENYEMKSYASNVMAQDRTQRDALIAEWAQAAPGQKSVVWARVQRYNATRPAGERLTLAQLTNSMARRKRNQNEYAGGMYIGKHYKKLHQELSVFDTQ